MARLEGKPGSYDIPSRGQVITKSGLVTCPDEDAHEFVAHGFRIVSLDGPTAPTSPTSPPSPTPIDTTPPPAPPKQDEARARESLDYTKGLVEAAKTEHILSTQTYATPERPNRSRVRAQKEK